MMKKELIKHLLYRSGLWFPLNLLRKGPEILQWSWTGLSGFAPHPIKMLVIGSYLRKFSLESFIETGTYLGDTLAHIAGAGVQCTSIELSPELYKAACNRFKGYKNVFLIQGDSSQKLPEVLKDLTKPTLFWLDGHYSSGITAGVETNTPILVELHAILEHMIKDHVILIDDARCFNGTNRYPHSDELLRIVRENGNYVTEVSADIFRLTPRLVG